MNGDIHEFKAIDDKTGKCLWIMCISKQDMIDTAKLFNKFEEDVLIAHVKSEIKLHVPQSVQNNISKICLNTKQLICEFYQKTGPMFAYLLKVASIEADICKSCNSFWDALKVDDAKAINTHLSTAQAKRDELKKVKADNSGLVANPKPYIEAFEKRLKQFAEQIAKVNKALAPNAHKVYTEFYNELKSKVDECVKHHASLVKAVETENEFFDMAAEKYDLIKNTVGKRAADKKQSAAQQPPSPTRTSSPTPSASSKEGSPEHSANNSRKNSPAGSPALSAAAAAGPADCKHLSSSKAVMFGNNSQALQQQMQELTLAPAQMPQGQPAAASKAHA